MFQQFSIFPVLYLLGAAHGVFLAVALFTHTAGSRKANVYLGLYTLIFVAALCDYFIDLNGLAQALVSLRVILWPKEFLYGVLLYFYTRELTTPGKYSLQGRQWWHFAPTFAHLLLVWPLLLLPQATQHAILYDGGPLSSQFFEYWALLLGDIELIITVLQLTIYLTLCLQLLRRHRERLVQAYSYRERISLDWLSYLITGTMAVYFVWLAEEFLSLGRPMDQWLDIALGLSMVILIYSMSILGLRQAQIFAPKRGQEDGKELNLPRLDTVEAIDCENKQKYQHSALSAELSEALMETVESAMQKDRLYRDPMLSLPQLSEKLDMPINYLSQAINQQKGQNFFDYINSYRVQEVARLMQESPDSGILDLALAAGFNSKSPFYAAFRKHTGMTPGQLRKSFPHPSKSS